MQLLTRFLVKKNPAIFVMQFFRRYWLIMGLKNPAIDFGEQHHSHIALHALRVRFNLLDQFGRIRTGERRGGATYEAYTRRFQSGDSLGGDSKSGGW